MTFANAVKSLGLVGVTSLALFAGASQAADGYYGYPYYNNPYQYGPGYQMQVQATFKQQLAYFEQRLDNQLQRILTGMEQGRLTMPEAVKLLREHLAINVRERQFLNDGRLGPNELRELEQRLDAASRHIFLQGQDRDQRGYPHYR